MEKDLQAKYQSDKEVWNDCAATYEEQIVTGHPDVVAYEKFEEHFLDNLIQHVIKKSGKPVKLIDVGCGSGRLHLRYGKYVKIPSLEIIKGIDFSNKMLEIARSKLKQEGISDLFYPALKFEQGSAFNLVPESNAYLPVAVNLINSIGVMQGEEGAKKLFQAMRRCVEEAGGISVISCYQRCYIRNYALPQYESTMNVCGQPVWLKPDKYASEKYQLKPKYYKRANSKELSIEVEVYENDRLIKPEYLLYRDKDITEQTIKSGKIKTHTNYESNWYSFLQIEEWIKNYWDGLPFYHIKTSNIDPKNAEAGQLAILDIDNNLKGFESILA